MLPKYGSQTNNRIEKVKGGNEMMRSPLTFWQLVLFCFFAAVSHTLAAQQALTLWQDTEESAFDGSDLLPAAISYQRAVSIDPVTLGLLEQGNTVLLELAPSEFVVFQLNSRSSYLNGDTGWRGTAIVNGRQAALSLTYSGETVLATVNTGANRYRVTARRANSGDYLGYIYLQGVGAPRQKIDEGGMPLAIQEEASEPAAVLAITGNDVTITQQVSSEIAVVGEQVDISITVTNNTGATLTNEELNVLFVLDNSQLVSSSGNCTTANLGSQLSLQCALPDLAAGANTSVSYSVRLTDDSYPFISSGAFVGDVFGTENVRNDDFVFVARDTETDSDGDGQSDFNENLAGTDPGNSASVIDSNATVETDLMFLYTQKFLDDIGNVSPETKINQLVETTNGYYANSRVNIVFRPVLYRFVDFTLNNSLNNAFNQLQNAQGVFSFVPGTQDKIGADIVVLLDGIFLSDSACGLGTTPGVGYSGEIFHESTTNADLYVTLYTDGFPEGGGSGCDDLTLAHELGHNHGLDHSHREAGAAGTFSYSLGHGVDGSFATIMASPSDYPGSEELPYFSNPDSTDCNGLPCGVSRNDVEMGADAVYTLNHTRFQVSKRRASRILPVSGLSGSSNLIAYGGASLSSDLNTPVSTFSASDAIDVRATLEIPSEHQGSIGETYVVIVVGGLQFFFRDSGGEYQIWDGSLETLQPNIVPRALNATEELVAFENLIPASVGVDSAELTVYFAYAITGTDVFVFSSNGVPLTIQP